MSATTPYNRKKLIEEKANAEHIRALQNEVDQQQSATTGIAGFATNQIELLSDQLNQANDKIKELEYELLDVYRRLLACNVC